MPEKKAYNTQFIKRKGKELGFSLVGISKAECMDEESKRLRNWLNKGYHGEMRYMERHFDPRTDPRALVPGAKSVISLSYNYFTEKSQHDQNAPKVSMYAFGRDYHKVLKKKLKRMMFDLKEEIKDFQGRYFVDSAPVLERDWARKSGVGWVGKNTMLIHPKHGSYFFLAELIVNTELEYDSPLQDYCGTCRNCIEACPTDAISPEGYEMDGSKCISYLTIELKDIIPSGFKDKMENWVFGCDICQEVCPWNKFSEEHSEPEFKPSEEFLGLKLKDWENLDQEQYDRIFKGSAVKRANFQGLKRNLKFLYED